MKIKIELKNRWSGKILFELETENNTVKETVLKAIEVGANLRGADLEGANLRSANLEGADLRSADLEGADLRSADLRSADLRSADLRSADLEGADLRSANLRGANLRGADLEGADLEGADLRGADLRSANLRSANLRSADLRSADLEGANLEPIRTDMFMVLLHGKNEVKFLRQSIIDGKIDGSTYNGDCACLSGTLINAAVINNGDIQPERERLIMTVRDSYRPIERFFLGIQKDDTPGTNQFSALALKWVDEFIKLIE